VIRCDLNMTKTPPLEAAGLPKSKRKCASIAAENCQCAPMELLAEHAASVPMHVVRVRGARKPFSSAPDTIYRPVTKPSLKHFQIQ
jgi:hypothetical protein